MSRERVAGWLSQYLTFLRPLDEILDYDLRHLHRDNPKKDTQVVKYQTRRLKLTRMEKRSKSFEEAAALEDEGAGEFRDRA